MTDRLKYKITDIVLLQGNVPYLIAKEIVEQIADVVDTENDKALRTLASVIVNSGYGLTLYGATIEEWIAYAKADAEKNTEATVCLCESRKAI